ncbi:hypothetical protein An03g00800 [Aspergillus niger]|uniref:Uncharacterized protein n=2 Tax=Aspergillus niger TaxID=5061 RepID=A2QFU3_ASPNC|nr:hypothetical protein An03g00800 [Aspergillus niger]CAK38053.1 hypothetical protein An03g00800 [Aspergillus niger]
MNYDCGSQIASARDSLVENYSEISAAALLVLAPKGQCTTTPVAFGDRALLSITPQSYPCIKPTNSISCLDTEYTGRFSDGATSCATPAPPSSSAQPLMQGCLSDSLRLSQGDAIIEAITSRSEKEEYMERELVTRVEK